MNRELLNIAENMINRLLALDGESLGSISKYQGRQIRLIFGNTDLQIFVRIEPDGVRILQASGLDPDVTLKGSPVEFLRFMMTAGNSESIQTGSLEVAGDISFAQNIFNLIRKLDPDWEEYLSRWVGDPLAHQSGRIMHGVAGLFKNTAETMRNSASEYLRYETDYLVSGDNLETFIQAVDDLRDDVERLKIRLDRLHGRER